jgi:small-conductance mechanosensitive channel
VLFAEFGDWSIKFNLICFVEDIEQAERTRSDINFEVLRRLREAGLRIAYPAAPPADVPWKFQPETKPALPPQEKRG